MKPKNPIAEELSPRDIVAFVLRSWKLFAVFSLISGSYAIYHHASNPAFTAETTLLVLRSSNSAIQALSAKMSGLGGAASLDENHLEKYLLYLRSRKLAQRAAEALKTHPRLGTIQQTMGVAQKVGLRRRIGAWLIGEYIKPAAREVDAQVMAGFLAGSTRFDQSGMNTIKISVTTREPETSSLVLNHILDVAVSDLTERDLKELNDAKKFIESQLRAIETRQEGLDRMIVSFLKKNRLVGDAKTKGAQIEEISDLKRELAEAEVKLEHNKGLMELLQHQRAPAGDTSAESGDSLSNPKYGNGAKIYRLQRENEFLTTRIQAIRKLLDLAMDSRKQLPEIEQTIEDLRKKTELEHLFYTDLRRELLGIEVERISTMNKIQTLERPTLADVYSSSRLVPRLSFALAVAFVLAGALAYLIDAINPSIRSLADLKGYHLWLLGAVPDFDEKGWRAMIRDFFHPKKDPSDEEGAKPSEAAKTYLLQFSSDSPEAMVFKNLRARLLNITTETIAKPQVLAVMSANRAEGKTLVTANLALALAQMKKRTIMIDCDIRRQALSEAFHATEGEGLGHYLMMPEKKTDHGQSIVRSIRPCLDILPAGRYSSDVTEMFTSETFSEMIKALRQYYDYILLDTPPTVPFADTAPIASVSDLVLMSVVHGKTKIDHVERALEKIHFCSRSPVAVILNKHGALEDLTYGYMSPSTRKAA